MAILTGALFAQNTPCNKSNWEIYYKSDGQNMENCNLTGADLTGADLTGADLTGADLTGADLTGADLTGANLTGAKLVNANLKNTFLTGSNFSEVILTYKTNTFTVFGVPKVLPKGWFLLHGGKRDPDSGENHEILEFLFMMNNQSL